MSEAIKIILGIAIYATVFTLAVIFFILWIREQLKESENFCAYCGDLCEGKFCCKSHELLFYEDEDFARNEEIAEAEEKEALREIKEVEREEKRSKAH